MPFIYICCIKRNDSESILGHKWHKLKHCAFKKHTIVVEDNALVASLAGLIFNEINCPNFMSSFKKCYYILQKTC